MLSRGRKERYPLPIDFAMPAPGAVPTAIETLRIAEVNDRVNRQYEMQQAEYLAKHGLESGAAALAKARRM